MRRHLLWGFNTRSGPVLQVLGVVAGLGVGAAILPHLTGPVEHADQSVVRHREPADGYRGVAPRAVALPPRPVLVFVSAYMGANPEMLDWMELERERLGLSALYRAGAELPLFLEETADTAPLPAELEHQREQLDESIIVRTHTE